jgi:hypothetical protein
MRWTSPISTVDRDSSESYLDWRVGISKEVLGFGLDVSYWDAENGSFGEGTISRRF